MSALDELMKELGLGDDREPLMVPPPPTEREKKLQADLEFAKHQETPAYELGRSGDIIRKARDAGQAAAFPPPPQPPPAQAPDDVAPNSRDVINTAAEAGAVATGQFPPQQSRAKALLERLGRGAGRLSDLAEQPFAWESKPPPPPEVPGQQSVEPPPEANASVSPPASFDPSSRARELLARARNKETAEPPSKATGDTGRADLLAAIDKAAKPPEAAAEQPAPAQGQAGSDSMTPPPTPPPESERTGGALAALQTRLSSGSEDPRTQRLRDALAKAAEMKRVAGHITGMGIGADLALGTHVHGNQGKPLEDQADDLVRQETLPAKFENENRRADLEQAKGAQDLELRGNQDRRAAGADVRAGHADSRAQAAELRASRKAATEQDLSDPSSRVSQNMREAAQALYSSTWQKIPQRIRDNYSAADVERIFKEVSLKDFAKGGPSRAQGTEDRFEEKQVHDYNKNRITDRTVESVNNLMARLQDPAPISGFDAAKGWSKAEKIPVLGGLLSGAGNSAVRGTEMEGITQDALTIMQQISLDTSGKVLNATEMNNIEKRLGLATGQGEDAFRRAMQSEFDAIQAKANRDYESLSPGAREKVDQRKLRPTFKASSSTGYAPKENTVVGEREKDTKSTVQDLLDKAKGFFSRE